MNLTYLSMITDDMLKTDSLNAIYLIDKVLQYLMMVFLCLYRVFPITLYYTVL